jgi:hypothetical protein
MMRKFNYRAVRLSVHLPVTLNTADSLQEGFCTEISTEGMRVALAKPWSPFASGAVSLNFERLNVVVPVSMVRTDGNSCALRFAYESQEQRNAIATVIACVCRPRPCTSLVLRSRGPEPQLPALLSSY